MLKRPGNCVFLSIQQERDYSQDMNGWNLTTGSTSTQNKVSSTDSPFTADGKFKANYINFDLNHYLKDFRIEVPYSIT